MKRLLPAGPLLFLAAVVVAFYAELALTNRILARGDVLLYFYPYWQAASEAFKTGRLPLWNPSLFMGAPFLANSQAGVLYPLNWPLWLLLPAPAAVTTSVLLHLFIAAWGTAVAGRRLLGLGTAAAILSGVLFGLGGYLTAQVEHVNQIQGLAWLPWQLVVLGSIRDRPAVRSVGYLGGLFALQLLAGHTQTAFIAGIGLGTWALTTGFAGYGASQRSRWQPALVLGAGALVAILLAMAQLLPTLELTGLSSRQGGLPYNEVVSFSWHPLLATRSLLPQVRQSLFTEYTAYLPLLALFMALAALPGSWRQHRRQLLPVVLLIGLGLALALGRFNPLYWGLARLPGFDLFRAPARWLVWYALGAALLAGWGWQRWWNGYRWTRRGWLTGFGLLALLVLWAWLAFWLSKTVPLGAETPAEAPGRWTIALWLAEAFGLLGCLFASRRWPRAAPGAAWALMALSLFVAGRSQPAHNPTAPEAFHDLRPTIARLQVALACLIPDEACPAAPGRTLSLSDIFFDTGDKLDLEQIYGPYLGPGPLLDYLVAVKQKEVIAPNLSLTFGLQSVDGFDGGVLPLAAYSDLTRLLLPDGSAAVDGRLRERLQSVPARPWLDLLDVGYVITDKVGDSWHEGVYFDRQHPATIGLSEPLRVTPPSAFPATALWIWAAGGSGSVAVTFADGRQARLTPEPLSGDLWTVSWATPGIPVTLDLHAGAEPWQITALSLVDGETGTFLSLVPGPYRVIQSGDVKLYEVVDSPGRAVLFADWQWVPDRQAALAVMAAPGFDPANSLVVTGKGPEAPPPAAVLASPGEASVVAYSPEFVSVKVRANQPAALLLKDTAYPGWRATLDGDQVPWYEADGIFRAVMVPAGDHRIVFEYRPVLWPVGLIVSLGAFLVLAVAVGLSFRQRTAARH